MAARWEIPIRRHALRVVGLQRVDVAGAVFEGCRPGGPSVGEEVVRRIWVAWEVECVVGGRWEGGRTGGRCGSEEECDGGRHCE